LILLSLVFIEYEKRQKKICQFINTYLKVKFFVFEMNIYV
jgi:hypothetical protein